MNWSSQAPAAPGATTGASKRVHGLQAQLDFGTQILQLVRKLKDGAVMIWFVWAAGAGTRQSIIDLVLAKHHRLEFKSLAGMRSRRESDVETHPFGDIEYASPTR